jgi:hypothetical protein
MRGKVRGTQRTARHSQQSNTAHRSAAQPTQHSASNTAMSIMAAGSNPRGTHQQHSISTVSCSRMQE